jgi:precorrin-2 dehydrogenase/sirohydrochlorin ferrochelatase
MPCDMKSGARPYYPVMLNVRNKPVLVIGADDSAAEKARSLVDCGARVTVIGPAFGGYLRALAASGAVALWEKHYQPGDMAGYFLVVAVTADPQVAQDIWEEAEARGTPVNVVDVPERCTFIVPSILRRGPLTIAVSTAGTSPGLAKRIRQQLEPQFPPAYGTYLELAAAARCQLRRRGISYSRRDAFFGDYFHSAVLALLARGDESAARSLTCDLLRQYGVEVTASELVEGA